MLREITFASSVILVSQVSAIDCDTNISERPKGAPVISKVVHDRDWHVQALHGISKPYPYSFSFIKNQGNWYTPFNKAGMLGPYDIRGWHK
jgi:hypothetical protein